MTYIPEEIIKKYCGFCNHVDFRISKKTQNKYAFCEEYRDPCFKVLELCQYTEKHKLDTKTIDILLNQHYISVEPIKPECKNRSGINKIIGD